MTLETQLTSLPPDQWQTRQVVVFDWYDGPREGICSLAAPGGEFSFELLEERPTDDDLDDRLFRLSELPAGSVEEVVSLLGDLGRPEGPVWVPIWRFADEHSRQTAEQHLQALQKAARPTPLLISTRDMIHFAACGRVEGAEKCG